MKTIIKWTIWQRRWSILWWSLGVGFFIFINLIFYPAVRDQASQLNQSLERLPDTARSLFTDTADFLSPVGYLSSQIFYLMLPMLLSILAIGMGSSLIAKEENEGTLELLLSRSISRGRLMAGKAVAGVFILSTVGIVAMITTVILSSAVHIEVGLGRIALATIMSAIMALLFGAIAFYMTAIGRKGRLASIGIASLIAFGGYIITSLVGLASWLRWPDKVLPYHYYHPGDILNGEFSWGSLLGLLAVTGILGVLSWLAFRRRDIGS